MIQIDDYLYFADQALMGMSSIVIELGDEIANTVAYEGANTPYALLHHCLAVTETWVGGFICGRPISRDRDAEFRATGSVELLAFQCATAADQLRRDAAVVASDRPLAYDPPASYLGLPRALTQGAVLQHVYEELAQHRGQMEILRDVLLLQPSGRQLR